MSVRAFDPIYGKMDSLLFILMVSLSSSQPSKRHRLHDLDGSWRTDTPLVEGTAISVLPSTCCHDLSNSAMSLLKSPKDRFCVPRQGLEGS
mmetsp:Transcript_39659/g.82422  ORF Transcript_39659/g.82422 Transcript_39659/m.82422 type:complete len:91 (+) Transcript_39659:185-457(+)